MNRKVHTILFALVLIFSFCLTVNAEDVVITDNDLQEGQTYNWTADNTYILEGFVYLEAGGVLNIEAGTVVKARGRNQVQGNDRTSALIITKGALINAIGTAQNPIIFTNVDDDTNDPTDFGLNNRGTWGGLIILGNAPVSEDGGEDFVEGLPSTEARAFYGGDAPEESSGTLNYVSIRHGGDELEEDTEINGLTLGGVGSGTVIEYVEVVSNSDDGIEIFGGNVNIKHAITAFCGDESFDYDESWAGKGQFWFALKGFDEGDQPGEHDGSEAAPSDPAFYTSLPEIYNATYIGPGDTAQSVKAPRVLSIKSAGTCIYGNSIFTGFAKEGIQVQDLPDPNAIDSYHYMLNDSVKVHNTIWFSQGWESIDDIVKVDNDTAVQYPGAPQLKEKLTGEWANTIENPLLYNIDRGTYDFLGTEIIGDGALDPRPSEASPAFNDLGDYPLDEFFEVVDYKGAFGGETNWALGWTALDELGFFADYVGIYRIEAIQDLNLAPNPSNHYTDLTISLDESVKTNIALYNLAGQLVRNISDGVLPQGTSTFGIQTSDLNAGVYFVKITAEGNDKIVAKKLIVK